MRGLCIENDALHPELKEQDVALTVYGNDFTYDGALPDDLIERYKDVLPDWLRPHKVCRQRYRECLIEGTVDFIFGCAAAVAEKQPAVQTADCFSKHRHPDNVKRSSAVFSLESRCLREIQTDERLHSWPCCALYSRADRTVISVRLHQAAFI